MVLILSGQFYTCPDSSKTVQTVLKQSGWFENCTYSVETVRTGLTLSVHFQHCLDWYKRVRMVLILSRQFCPDGFQTVRTVSNCPDGFQTVWTVFKLSGRFSNCPGGSKTIWTVGQKMKSIYCESEQNHGFVRKACCCHMPYAFCVTLSLTPQKKR